MITRYYSEIETTVELISIDTAAGDYLDQKCAEHNITRIAAVANVRAVTLVGATITAGVRFFADDQYFVSVYDDDGNIVLQAETAGEAVNSIASGAALVPVNTIAGLTSATLGNTITAGSAKESDTHLRNRLKEKISESAENGNKQNYKTWCEEISGVGVARIAPLWNGVNTVKAVLIGTDGLPAGASVVEAVQEYIDPGSSGLGEGQAPIGAYFTATAADSYAIDVAFSVQLSSGAVLADVQTAAETALAAYFKSVALTSSGQSSITIRTTAIANVIYDLDGVTDYSGLTINAGTENLTVPYTAVPVLGVLTVGEL